MANILIVDDELDILETLPNVFRAWGHYPLVARNGEEGLRIYQEQVVDCIITDIRMPEMDGLSLLQRIKMMDKNAMVILLTGYPSVDSAITALRQGAYDYLIKPVNLDEMRLRIERGLESREQKRRIPMLRGINWALIISIPLWLILGIILARALR